MPISTLDQLIAAASQRVSLFKTASRTSVAAVPFSVFDLAGNPGAGTLAGTSTVAGVVPTDTTSGHPMFQNFAGGATGYISKIEFGNTVASRLTLFDMLFKAGAYPFNASATLSGQPSYAYRVPNGTDFTNTEIWVEAVTAFTGSPVITVTYTNQDGVTGRTTGSVGAGAALTVGRMMQLPLQAGDSGVQKIESVTCTVATAGTFNVLVMRRLWQGRVRVANDGDVHDMLKTGLPVIFQESALFLAVQADGTATGNPEVVVEVVNG